MVRKLPPDQPDHDSRVEQMSLPLEARIRLAESRRRLALTRYKLGVRQGAAWFDHSRKKDARRND